MTGFASTIGILLLIVSLAYFVSLTKVRHDALCLVIFSLGKVTLIINTLASLAITFWIAFSETAFRCENRTDDFLVNVTNTICYSVILLHLASRKFNRPLIKFCIRCVGFIVLVGVQIAVSALAHFFLTSDGADELTIIHCSEERQKPLSVASYFYSVILLSVNVLLYFFSQCRKQGRRTTGRCAKMTIATVTLFFYVVFIGLFLWVDESICSVQVQFLIIVSVYPSLVCLIMAVVAMATCLYKQRRRKRNRSDIRVKLKGEQQIRKIYNVQEIVFAIYACLYPVGDLN